MVASTCHPSSFSSMSYKKVIVKRLNSIQNLGAMDILCTDKTGTLTLDRVIRKQHCDVVRQKDDGVLHLAFLLMISRSNTTTSLPRASCKRKKCKLR